MNKKVYVNALASVCCAGDDNETLFSRIVSQETGIEQNTSYFEGITAGIGKIDDDTPFNRILVDNCLRVLSESSLEDFKETLLVVGSSVGGMAITESIFFRENSYKNVDPEQHPINSLARELQEALHFKDHLSFSTACTSSANAIGYAYEVIRKSIYRNVLVVGADSLSKTTVGGFSSLGVLSEKPCTPFDKGRDGMNVAEGIGILLIQDTKEEKSVELCGVGYSSDAHHMTQPHPEGRGAVKAMTRALQEAGLSAENIDYINAHGTGTVANDLSELTAIKTLFKDKPHVSSTKSITGHTLGAAGALEANIVVTAMLKGTVPPNIASLDPDIAGINYPLKAVNTPIRYALSNSLAFGGNNTSLIFGLPHDA